MDFEIVPLPKPVVGEEPHSLIKAYLGYQEIFDREEVGHNDFAIPIDNWVEATANETSTRSRRWVALPAGTEPDAAVASDILGTGLALFFVQEDLELAQIHVTVRHDVRSHGIGRALADACMDAAREEERSTLVTLPNTDAVDEDSQHALKAVTGIGAVDNRAASTQWLVKDGWVLGQVEKYSILEIPPVGPKRDEWTTEITALRDGAASFAGPDYELILVKGYLPEEYHENMAELRRRMSIDTPSGAITWDEQKWDADRVAHSERSRSGPGRGLLTAMIRHRPSGDLVGFTVLYWNDGNAAAIYQGDTLVHGEHRGHRLGLWMKAANQIQLIEANPHAERIHTWNATENEHMLRVNFALGYRPRNAHGIWQRPLDFANED